VECISFRDVQEDDEGEVRQFMQELPEVSNAEEVESLKKRLSESERMVEDLK
jgi:hypothetical protein